MKHTNTRALYEYWNSLRGEDSAPDRDDIKPGHIKWLLPDVFILEYKGEAKFPFSLAGTHLCDHYGMELRGLNLCDFWHGKDGVSFSHVLQSVVEESAVGVIGFTAHTNMGRTCSMEMLVTPVRSPVRKPPRVMGSIVAFNPAILSEKTDEKISHHEIVSLRVLYPGKEENDVSMTVLADGEPETTRSISGNHFTSIKHLKVIEGGRRG